jgi:hypothetical protein
MPLSSAIFATRTALRRSGSHPVQRHRGVDGLHDRPQDPRDQRLVAQQRRPGGLVADLLRRAAHVDVDDLGAAVDLVAGGRGHHLRVGAGDLHRDRRRFAAMIRAAARRLGCAEPRVRRHHLRNREPGPEALAEAAEGSIRDAGHRRDEKIIPQHVRADPHASNGEIYCGRSAILRSKFSVWK